jgi:hypothetical protein
MDIIEKQINLIAQNRIEFNEGVALILNNPDFDFKKIFNLLRFFIFNSIPEKATYSTDTYQKAIFSIPLRQTFTPIVLLTKFPTKIAFLKLRELPENEYEKIIISLLWIFKITDTERRETECKNGCGHDWHENL